jgi:cytosine/adenosine deaminase-related metal-dependent hydrolase
MKKFAAHYIFPGNGKPIAKGIVKVDHSGLILDIVRGNGKLEEEASLEFHNGIICPAFVNVFHEFEQERFYRKFQALQEFEELRPSRLSTEKDLLGWLIAIQQKSNLFSLEQLIRIFTLDAAQSISLEKELGSIQIGKRPGLMLISGMDYQKLRLSENSHLKILV